MSLKVNVTEMCIVHLTVQTYVTAQHPTEIIRFTTLGLKIHNCLQCVMFWLHHLAGAMRKA